MFKEEGLFNFLDVVGKLSNKSEEMWLLGWNREVIRDLDNNSFYGIMREEV